ELIDAAREQIERRHSVVVQATPPFSIIFGGGRLRLESRIPAVLRERRMQLGRAYAEGLHECEISAVHVGRNFGRGALSIEEARQILERVCPCIALVAHVRLQNRERDERTVSL